ncbi:hypothetical protein KAFR_0A05570 [Kazachstania africana CBS 2517]|uniref:Uncharacterized protein n=1 Tax=Kazachstania africana (strain ATCC 22294 / BCRC 22015 / CBS 2517 / CECT 1963 / NBRC 1671 / NRRL Y-8276) TaxID=1071382 RepID=H2ANP2_KAZAF|nr:hypothetical protein KAFR_0A05570 [Kazachstania africana CBS 2517]CCF55992.1 hypothetical protein KAFR_0A05570 [Kazachstania africana CBS 2517]
MGNTDSRNITICREHLIKLANSDKSIYNTTKSTVANRKYATLSKRLYLAKKSNWDSQEKNISIPLFTKNASLEQLISIYKFPSNTSFTEFNLIFQQFYMDFNLISKTLTVETFNTLVSNVELKKIINSNFQNYKNLIRFCIWQIIFITNSLDFKDSNSLNVQLETVIGSVRILTKLIPAYYDHLSNNPNIIDILWDNSIESIMDTTFFEAHKTTVTLESLGQILLKSILKLCFVQGFTIPITHNSGLISFEYLWENGINTHNDSPSTNSLEMKDQNVRFDSNRLELITLLMVLSSTDLYSEKNASSKNKFLEMLITLDDEAEQYKLRQLINSLINLVSAYCLSYNLQQTNPYQNSSYKPSLNQNLSQLKSNLVQTSLQFINLLLLQDTQENIVISYIKGFLKKEYDFKLILSAITKVFKHPIEQAIEQESNPLSFVSSRERPDSRSYVQTQKHVNNNENYGNNLSNNIPHSVDSESSSIALPPVPNILFQVLLFLTNLLKFNDPFENYFADRFSHKFITFAIYYIKYYKSTIEYQENLIPLCYQLCLYLTSNNLVLYKLLQTFTVSYYTNKLPNFYKVPNIARINLLTYRDFIVIQLSHLAISDIKKNSILEPFIFELIYNILPINSNVIANESENHVLLSNKKHHNESINSETLSSDILSYNTSMALLNLLAKFSNKTYLSSFSKNYFNNSYYSPEPNNNRNPTGDRKVVLPGLSLPALKLDMLALTLRAMLNYVILYPLESKNLTILLSRHQNILLQLRDSINYITKNHSTNIEDYLLIDHPLKSNDMENDETMTENGDDSDISNRDSNESLSTPYLFFDRIPPGDSDSVDSDVEDYNKRNDFNLGNSMSDSNSTEAAGAQKSLQLYEQSDYNKRLIVNNKDLFLLLQPIMPVGLGKNSKLKTLKDQSFNHVWTGFESLNILLRVSRLILARFPELMKISRSSEYYEIINNKFVDFQPTLTEKVESVLPIYLRTLKVFEPLVFDLSTENKVFHEWLLRSCWADIFNTHSNPYMKLNDFFSESDPKMNLQDRKDANSTVSPSLPVLERWASNSSTLSRTTSNGSSVMNLMGQDNISSSNTNEYGIPNVGSQPNLTRKNSNSSSFFKLSWTGFYKNDSRKDAIEEEAPYGALSNNNKAFNLDAGLLKPNIWAGTIIKLFPTIVSEKEEQSFLDMTSSLLKKFRFNSNASVGAIQPTSANNMSSRGYNTSTISDNAIPLPKRFY